MQVDNKHKDPQHRIEKFKALMDYTIHVWVAVKLYTASLRVYFIPRKREKESSQ